MRFRLTNHCDVALELERAGKLGPKTVSVPPHASTLIRAKVPASSETHKFEYVVSNFLIAPAKGLPVSLEVPPQITISRRGASGPGLRRQAISGRGSLRR